MDASRQPHRYLASPSLTGLTGDTNSPVVPVNAMRASEVDALRCIAMTAVMALHAGICPPGWVGVWLFYVISGYVVTKSMIGRETASGVGTRLRHFFRRRFVRIIPVYYLYLLVGVAFTALLGIRQDWLALLSLAAFFDNYTMTIGLGNLTLWPAGHLWTISTEMQFYAVYGVTLCVASRRFNIWLLIAMLAIGPVARFVMSMALHRTGVESGLLAYMVYARPGLHVDIFAMGALLAFAADRWPITRFARPLFAIGLACLLLYVGVYLLVNVRVVGTQGITSFRNVISGILEGQWREVFVYSAVGAVATGTVALAAARDPIVGPILRLRPLQFVGVISYGAYLYHLLVMLSISKLFPAAAEPAITHKIFQFVVSYPLVIALAWLSFTFIEMPLNRRFGAERRLAEPASAGA